MEAKLQSSRGKSVIVLLYETILWVMLYNLALNTTCVKTDRICTLCKDNKIEDENHFLWHCPIYKHERELFEYKLSHIIHSK